MNMLSSIFGSKKDEKPQDSSPGSALRVPDNTSKPSKDALPNKPIQTSYVSNAVPIPADFLTTDPPDLIKPITLSPVDWPATKLPEYDGHYAVVLDNVISPSECEVLLRLAEASVPDSHKTGQSSWGPALVNVGMGFEVLIPDYRNSDRIIWDQQEIVDRLWQRCLKAEGLEKKLKVIENEPGITGKTRWGGKAGTRWEFRRVNQRMRFLKYGGGQFFKPHCDSPYFENSQDGKTFETLFTVHLYLNDSQQEVGKSVDLVGGATSFLSNDEKRKVDVDPKAGRVLIFQHRKLLHSGDDVKKGIKYTMRTDIMYEIIPADDK
ncbi:oxidoreductase domain-containing protein [Apodospora peruviana]|uniref:Oxidoreductase domain-containing protein n=1 Tax=Apodospora peruviana TaxID=516989 RepID=A0AAE0IKH8_9PEZI|nr:oxidoreductase domain-containing protein [Apodospora peruviana]